MTCGRGWHGESAAGTTSGDASFVDTAGVGEGSGTAVGETAGVATLPENLLGGAGQAFAGYWGFSGYTALEIGDICVAVVRVAREALDLRDGLRDLALRRWDLEEEERDLRVLLRRWLRLRQVEVLRGLERCRRRRGLEGLAARYRRCRRWSDILSMSFFMLLKVKVIVCHGSGHKTKIVNEWL